MPNDLSGIYFEKSFNELHRQPHTLQKCKIHRRLYGWKNHECFYTLMVSYHLGDNFLLPRNRTRWIHQEVQHGYIRRFRMLRNHAQFLLKSVALRKTRSKIRPKRGSKKWLKSVNPKEKKGKSKDFGPIHESSRCVMLQKWRHPASNFENPHGTLYRVCIKVPLDPPDPFEWKLSGPMRRRLGNSRQPIGRGECRESHSTTFHFDFNGNALAT